MIERAPTLIPILRLARKRIRLEELRHMSRHSAVLEQGYEITMKNLEFLLEQGLVAIIDGRVVIGELPPHPWIKQGLIEGHPAAWEIVDCFQEAQLKFNPDSEVLTAIGLSGEEFVMNTLRETMSDEHFALVKHVSKFDDTAGYDIEAPMDPSGTPCFLEVKATTRPHGSFTFYLSRNESVRSNRLSNWFLVLVSLVGGVGSIFGHLDSRSLTKYMPSDQHRDFQWQSTSGKLSKDDVYAGLPVRF